MTTPIEKREHWNRHKPIDADSLCVGCGGPHPFDTSVPSVAWNRVIRGRGLPDYLCTTCIVRAFVQANESFTAQLWAAQERSGDDWHGVPIEVIVRGHVSTDTAAVVEENNRLRARLRELGDDTFLDQFCRPPDQPLTTAAKVALTFLAVLVLI